MVGIWWIVSREIGDAELLPATGGVGHGSCNAGVVVSLKWLAGRRSGPGWSRSVTRRPGSPAAEPCWPDRCRSAPTQGRSLVLLGVVQMGCRMSFSRVARMSRRRRPHSHADRADRKPGPGSCCFGAKPSAEHVDRRRVSSSAGLAVRYVWGMNECRRTNSEGMRTGAERATRPFSSIVFAFLEFFSERSTNGSARP